MSEWLAALIVGVPALVVSVIAVAYARSSAQASARSADGAKRAADAAEQVAGVERERRHEERMPRIEASIYRRGKKSSHPELRLTHTGGAECEVVEVTLEAPGAYPPVIAEFSHTKQPWIITSFKEGDHQGITTVDPADGGGRVIVRCLCRNGDEQWEVRVPVDVRRLARVYGS